MYKKIFVLLVVVSAMLSINAFSMTVVTDSGGAKNTNTSTNSVKKMMTTKGTFYLSTDITVINRSGLEQAEIALQKNPPVIQIDKVGRQVRVITILPNTQ